MPNHKRWLVVDNRMKARKCSFVAEPSILQIIVSECPILGFLAEYVIISHQLKIKDKIKKTPLIFSPNIVCLINFNFIAIMIVFTVYTLKT